MDDSNPVNPWGISLSPTGPFWVTDNGTGVSTIYEVTRVPAAKPSTNNCQLELTIQRGNKSARYRLALNSGGLTTELMDRFAERQEGLPPQTISLNAVLSPFEEGGGEVTLTLNRYITYKTKAQPQGTPYLVPPGASEKEKEVTASKSIPLMTKVALFPGKPVVIFEDEDEKISLKLTELGSEVEKP